VPNADMPGIDPGSVNIDVEGQLLTIRAERTVSARGDAKWLSQERTHGSYLRQFSDGEGIDSEKITAHFDNSVLSMLIPVSERAKPQDRGQYRRRARPDIDRELIRRRRRCCRRTTAPPSTR
jgi:HSP20 family protein